MSTKIEVQPNSERELVLCRILNAPVEQVYRAWTDPNIMKKWFAPKPWSIAHVEADVRPGGTSMIVMRSPEGQEFPSSGVYLEVIPNKKLVFTDAYTKAWEPSEKPFMTVTVTFEDQGGKTKYTARAVHWSKESTEEHVKMGFHEGWGQVADQLEDVASKL